jgi:hypothetical protein
VVHCGHENHVASTAAIAGRAETVAHALTKSKSPYASATGFLFGESILDWEFSGKQEKPDG